MEKEEELRTKLEKIVGAIKDRPSTIAKKAGINQSNLSGALNGKRLPTYEMLLKIARAYKEINPLYVMYDGDHPVLRVDEDFIPYMCKDTYEVIKDMKNYRYVSYGELLDRTDLNVLRYRYVIPKDGYDVDDYKEEGYSDYLETIERGLTIYELLGLHDANPEFNLFWLMRHEGNMFDNSYSQCTKQLYQFKRDSDKLRLRIMRLEREIEEMHGLVSDKDLLATYDDFKEKRRQEEERLDIELFKTRNIRQSFLNEEDYQKKMDELADFLKKVIDERERLLTERFSHD